MASKQEPIKVGIAGIGRAGWGMHCEELKGREDRFRIVAACDTVKARRDKMAARYQGCRTYGSIEDLVRDPEVELVDIATRSNDHCAHALLALKAGKSVFIEKPMCVNLAEARKLVQADNRRPGRLFVRHNRRFEPAFVHMREIVASGVLGSLHNVELRRGGYQRRDDWQTIKSCGGGQLLNWGPHIADHALQMIGGEPSTMGAWLKRVAAVGDAEDYVRIILDDDNGLTVDLEISGGRIIGESEMKMSGTRGAAWVENGRIRLRYLDPKHKPPVRRARSGTPPENAGFGSPDDLKWIDKTIDIAPKARAGMSVIWDYLYEAIRLGKPFPISTDEAVLVIELLCMARKGTRFDTVSSKKTAAR